MKIIVLLKMVPDVVEELTVATDGRTLDTEFLRLIANELDNHALEEALLLKEKYSGLSWWHWMLPKSTMLCLPL